MHDQALDNLKHTHDYVDSHNKGERRTKLVLLLTFFTMLLEVTAGAFLGSIALLADGWHMATHVTAFMTTLFAYRYSRLHAHDHTFAFGVGKVGVLGGFASSVALAVVAVMMLVESSQRLFVPHQIQFDEALIIAGVGLVVNILSAFLLRNDGHRHEDRAVREEYEQDDDDDPKDYNHYPKSAYFHVIADALTSVLAIVALVAGKYYGWNKLDPVMGIVGAIIISHWAYGLIKETCPILLDQSIALRYKSAIQEAIEADEDTRIADLHIWPVSPGHFAVILSVVSHNPREPEYYKGLLTQFNLHGGRNYLAHITVEVNSCTDEFCLLAHAVQYDDLAGL